MKTAGKWLTMGAGPLLGLAFRYGMVLVLAALCLAFSLLTLRYQEARGEAGAQALAEDLTQWYEPGASLLIAAGSHEDDRLFAARLEELMRERGWQVRGSLVGGAHLARDYFEQFSATGPRVQVLAMSETAAGWRVWDDRRLCSGLADAEIITPPRFLWPDFLKRDNLWNVASQIAVIAIVAIGMTLVIITGGIDLSVGSLIGLSAVVSAWLIEQWAGGTEAHAGGLAACCLAGIVVCGLAGACSGLLVARADVPPFIVTLGMLMAASGLSLRISGGESIHKLPASFTEFALGAWLGLPNAVVLMIALYLAAHVLMSRTTLGRYIYAVGGNLEAARLAGVPIHRVRLVTYVISGLLAGLGGVLTASQFKSGTATYGQNYELYVIAAVVVGGTSLSGGEGTMIGTLIGAFTIAVIQNGMNLLHVESAAQRIVLGLVLLAAVVFDRWKQRVWQRVGTTSSRF